MAMANLPLVLRELNFESNLSECLTDDLSIQRRAETLAKDYLEGRRLFIFSATLRGPFQQNWRSPWHIPDNVIGSCVVASNNVNESLITCSTRSHSAGFVPINFPRQSLAPASGNVQVNHKAGFDIQTPEMAQSRTMKEQLVQHAMSAMEPGQDSGLAGNIASSKPAKRKQGKTFSKYKIQIFEDPEDTFIDIREGFKPSRVCTDPVEQPATVREQQDSTKKSLETRFQSEDEKPTAHSESGVLMGETNPNSPNYALDAKSSGAASTKSITRCTTDRRPNEKRIMKLIWPGGCLKTAHDFHGRLINLFGDEAEARLQQLLQLPNHQKELAGQKLGGNSPDKARKPKKHHRASQSSEFTSSSRRSKAQCDQANRQASSELSAITRASRRARRHTQNSSSVAVSVERKPSTEPLSQSLRRTKLEEHLTLPSSATGKDQSHLPISAENLEEYTFSKPQIRPSNLSALDRPIGEESQRYICQTSQEVFSSPKPSSSKKRARFSDECEAGRVGEPVRPCVTESQNSLIKSAMKKQTSSMAETTSEYSAPTVVSDSCVNTQTVATESEIQMQNDDHSSIAVLIPSFSSAEDLDYVGPLVDAISQDLAVDLV